MIGHFSEKKVYKCLGDILIELGIINNEQRDLALKLHKDSSEYIPSGTALIKLGFATEEDILHAINIQYSIPYLPLDNYDIDLGVIHIIPAELARRHLLVPIEKMGNILSIAMSNPFNIQVLKDIEDICQCEVRIFITSPSEVRRAINKYYHNDGLPVEKQREGIRLKVDIYINMILNNYMLVGIKLQNVSVRGLCGITAYQLRTDEQVELVLHYPFFENPVKRKARVAWCRNQGEGKDIWETGLDFGRDSKIDLSKYIFLNSHRP